MAWLRHRRPRRRSSALPRARRWLRRRRPRRATHGRGAGCRRRRSWRTGAPAPRCTTRGGARLVAGLRRRLRGHVASPRGAPASRGRDRAPPPPGRPTARLRARVGGLRRTGRRLARCARSVRSGQLGRDLAGRARRAPHRRRHPCSPDRGVRSLESDEPRPCLARLLGEHELERDEQASIDQGSLPPLGRLWVGTL